MSLNRHLFALVFLCLLATVISAGAEPFQVSTTRAEDRVQFAEQKVVVFSSFGIGRMTLKPTTSWPENLTLRFCYGSGEGFQRMESITITTDSLRVRGTHRDKESMRFWFRGKAESRRNTEGGRIAVSFDSVDGALELKLPPHFADHSQELEIHWIDVFRD